MKIIKRKIYYLLFLFLIGISFIGVSVSVHSDDTLRGMGIGFCIIAIIKSVRYYRISKDPEKIKQLELLQREERLVFLANKSISTTFYISLFVQYIAMAIFLLLGKSDISVTICYITALQSCSYLACHIYFSKKY